MHHWATTGNFCSFLLMGNCYHKRDIFLLEKLGENGVQQLLRGVFNSTDWLPKRKLIGMSLPSHLERFSLFIRSNMISCIYLIDLTSIKREYIYVCTTFLLNAISFLFRFDFKSTSLAILFRF